MIILRLQGGMGNQMFQYAAAKAVALRLGTELLLDLGWYHSGTVKQGRVYSLGNFPNFLGFEQITCAEPSVSTAVSFRIITFRRDIFITPIVADRKSVV